MGELREIIEGILKRYPGPVAIGQGKLIKALGLKSGPKLDAVVGISEADGLIADTGSVVLLPKESWSIPLLPQTHIVLASTERLVADMKTYFEEMQEGISSSSILFITGPSRTADIEKILILGAHGPRELIVIILENVALPNN